MNVSTWLEESKTKLKKASIPSARLDAELLLAHSLNVNRSKLLTITEMELSKQQLEQADSLLSRRAKHEPLAYIRGFVEFYGLEIAVSPAVLIPRPETEVLVEQAIKLAPENSTVLDVGTGSGAIALALGMSRSDLDIYASDISPAALKIAEQNTKKLKLDITLIESDLLNNMPLIDVIVANLPYVQVDQERSPETNYEPKNALFADESGLFYYKKLLKQIPKRCKLLIVESEPNQVEHLIKLAKDKDFKYSRASDFISVFKRRV